MMPEFGLTVDASSEWLSFCQSQSWGELRAKEWNLAICGHTSHVSRSCSQRFYQHLCATWLQLLYFMPSRKQTFFCVELREWVSKVTILNRWTTNKTSVNVIWSWVSRHGWAQFFVITPIDCFCTSSSQFCDSPSMTLSNLLIRHLVSQHVHLVVTMY